MESIIYICGIYSFLLGLFHIFFWKLFNWKSELKKLSKANSAIMQILNLRLTYFFFFVAFVCFMFPTELYTTPLGNAFLAGNVLFWLGRTIEQFIFFPLNILKVNFLTFVFAIGAILFALPFML